MDWTKEERRPREQSRLCVFISYSRHDADFVDRLQSALHQRGIEAFVDLEDIEKGEEWWARIEQLITEADSIVFVLTPSSVISKVCQDEIDFAERLNKRLVPVVARNLEGYDVPDALRRLNYVFFTSRPGVDAADSFSEALNQLVRVLETDVKWIREHTRLATIARRWEVRARMRELLLSGRELSAAETWLTTRPRTAPDPTDLHRGFITQSRRAATQRQRVLVGISIAVSLVAATLTSVAVWQWGEAVAQRNRATANETRANEERDVALRTQSQLLAREALSVLDRGDPVTAALIALEGLRDQSSTDRKQRTRPFDHRANASLHSAVLNKTESRILHGDTARISDVAFSPDGKLLASAAHDPFMGGSSLKLWNIETSAEPLIVEDYLFPDNLAFSPDGRLLAFTDGNSIHFWDVANQAKLPPLEIADGKPGAITFSSDSDSIASGSDNGSVQVWNLLTRQASTAVRAHGESINRIAFSPDGTLLATASKDGRARLLTPGREESAAYLKGHEGEVTDIGFSRDGKFVVTAGEDGTVRLWDVPSREPIGIVGRHSVKVNGVSFSPRGQFIISASGSNPGDGDTLILWDAAKRSRIATLHNDEPTTSVAFSPDGNLVATGHGSYLASTELGKITAIRLWDLTMINRDMALSTKELLAANVTYSPDNKVVAIATRDKTVHLLISASYAQVAVLTGMKETSICLKYSPDGRWLSAATGAGQIYLWDVASARLAGEFHGHYKKINSIDFSPDSTRLASASDDRLVRIWQLNGLTRIGEFSGFAEAVQDVKWSPDGGLIATASRISTADSYPVRFWSVDGEPKGGLLKGQTGTIGTLAFSNNGRMLASGSSDSQIRVWNVSSREQLALFELDSKPVNGIAFVHDDTAVAAVYGDLFEPDPVVRLWDINARKLLATIDDQGRSKSTIAAALDAKQLATVSFAGALRIWPLLPQGQALIDHAKKTTPRCLTGWQRRQFPLDDDPPPWCITGFGETVRLNDPATWKPKWPYHEEKWKKWLLTGKSDRAAELPQKQD